MNKTICPFCSAPSFISDAESGSYFCFSCGMGGDRISYLRAYKDISYKEAARKLKVNLLEEEDKTKEKEAMFKALEEAENFYFSNRSLSKSVYLDKRKLKKETVKKFKLGYAEGGKKLIKALAKKGIDENTAKKAGLVISNPETGETYEKFWKRIMFPIHDENGRTIGFGGRVLNDEKPKYLNSAESLVFDKSHNLYAMDIAKHSSKDYFILAEGYVDVISLHQNGFDNAVASLGTSFTLGQAELISKYKKSVYIVYDSDEPGQKATEKAISILRKQGIEAKVVSVAPFKDVDELLVACGAKEFEKRLNSAIDGLAFLAKNKSIEAVVRLLVTET